MCTRGPALVLHLGGAASWRDYIQEPNEFLRETPRHCAISRIKGVSEFLTEPFMNHKYFRRIQFVEILYWTCDIMLDLWCTFVEQEINLALSEYRVESLAKIRTACLEDVPIAGSTVRTSSSTSLCIILQLLSVLAYAVRFFFG